MMEEAELESHKLLAEAQTEAQQRGDEERMRLEGEVIDLAARRDTLLADVDTLTQFETDYRDRLAAALEQDLEALRTRTTAAPGPVPEVEPVELPVAPEGIARSEPAAAFLPEPEPATRRRARRRRAGRRRARVLHGLHARPRHRLERARSAEQQHVHRQLRHRRHRHRERRTGRRCVRGRGAATPTRRRIRTMPAPPTTSRRRARSRRALQPSRPTSKPRRSSADRVLRTDAGDLRGRRVRRRARGRGRTPVPTPRRRTTPASTSRRGRST